MDVHPACGRLAAAALVLALGWPAFAQVNPAARGSLTYPRVATRNHAPMIVTQVAVSGLSPFQACGDTDGTLYIGSEVEPHVAVNPLNPNNIIGVWQQDRYSNGASRGVITGVSFDGGATWVTRTIPVSTCTGGDFSRATDPWVSFSPDGTAHQVVLGVTGEEDTGTSGVVVSRSSDGGLTWGAPTSLIRDAGNGFFNDKETITADPLDSRFVYAAWDRLGPTGNGPTMFARSTDGGASWEAARSIYNPGGNDQTIGNLVRVLPDGTLVNYATVFKGNNTSLNVLRSTDRGLTWSAPIFIANLGSLGIRDPVTNVLVRDGGIVPQMAVGPDGAIHVVWQDARFTLVRDSIAYSRSTDGGFTWSQPVRVNFDPTVAAFTPQVHVRDDGMIGVTYYDFRSDTGSASTLLTDFWLARSTDGVTWTETRVSNAFDLLFAPNAEGLFLGDYTGLASAGSTFVAIFGKTNSNVANRTDIVAANVTPGTITIPPLSLKRIGPAATQSTTYRAISMPEGDPGPEFWEAVSNNVARAIEARLPRRHARGGPPPASSAVR